MDLWRIEMEMDWQDERDRRDRYAKINRRATVLSVLLFIAVMAITSAAAWWLWPL